MKKLVFIYISFLALSAFSKEKDHHREHGAHKHGSGTLGIAFEEAKGRLELKAPSESIIGFEYIAQKEKDKKTQESQLAKLEASISEMVSFESALKCVVSKNKIEIVKDEQEANHSDTLAVFDVVCEKAPIGSKITFNIQKFFPKLQDLDVQIIAGNVQKSVEARKNGTSVEIKP